MNLALIDTSYVDQPAGTNKGAIQNIMTLNAGISLFFPFGAPGGSPNELPARRPPPPRARPPSPGAQQAPRPLEGGR